MKLEFYSEVFKTLLLKDVIIKNATKTIRTGKIKNFSIKQFHIKLYIENSKKVIKVLELPYPYRIDYTPTCTSLNYELTTFCLNNKEIYQKLKLLNRKTASKHYDNIIQIVSEPSKGTTL
jgi:hypothetical protein